MATFTDELKLIISVDPSGAVSVLKGFGTQTTAELEKAQQAAGSGGTAAGTAYGTNFANTALLGVQALASAAATLGITAFARTAISDADQFARANVQLDAELQAVGATAGVTESHIDSLSSSLQKSQDIYSGVVKQGAALLLTFTAIQNQPGAGNSIFDRALTDATAVSNVFQRDLPTAVTQLGRALEDPLTGIVSLQRGGLAISEQDKERVRSLAKQGDLLGAQSALLSAIESKGLVQAGQAAGQGDPVQKFQTEIETLKVAVGNDFLPLLRLIDDGLGGLESELEAIPQPLRGVAEGFAALVVGGAAVVGTVVSIRSALGALRAIQLSATGPAAVGAGEAAEVAAVGAAAGTSAVEVESLDAAVEQLTIQFATFEVDSSGVVTALSADSVAATQLSFDLASLGVIEVTLTEETGFLSAALSGLSAVGASVTASFAGVGLLGSLGAVAAGFAAFTVAFQVGKGLIGSTHDTFDKLHTDTDRIVTDLGTAKKQSDEFGSSNPFTNFGAVFGTLSHSTHQAVADFKTINTGLEQLADQKGPQAALDEINRMSDAIERGGGDAIDFQGHLHPAYVEIENVAKAAADAATGLQGFDAQFAQLAQGAVTAASDNTALAQSFLAIDDAKNKVANDKADIAGTGPEAVAAVKAESDAYTQLQSAVQGVTTAKERLADAEHSLVDAQENVTKSARSLLEAQQALAEFNSARGVQERALELDIITRRTVTTPEQDDQKKLDLLKQQDSNANKSQSLQDAVTNAQHSYADALYAVGKAQRDVTDAQRGVLDSTNKVATAEQNLQTAIQKRAQVAADARASLVKDELAVQAAVEQTTSKLIAMAQSGELTSDAWLTKIKNVADQLLPGGPFKTALDNALAEAILTYELTTSSGTGDTAQNKGKGHNAPPLLNGHVPSSVPTPTSPAAPGAAPAASPAAQGAGSSVTINQTNHFGGDAPATADLDHANRELGWRLSRSGRY